MRAAETCFARRGFHGTSMDEVVMEAKMSSSTVYRYFPAGKKELVHAVSVARLDDLVGKIRALAQGDGLTLEQSLAKTLAVIAPAPSNPPEERARMLLSCRLAVHAWAEVGQDADLGEEIRSNYRALQLELTHLASHWIETGAIREDMPAYQIAHLLQNVLFGLVAEQVITGSLNTAAAVHQVTALLRCPAV